MTVWHVRSSGGTDGAPNDGLSYANAWASINYAIGQSTSGDTIHLWGEFDSSGVPISFKQGQIDLQSKTLHFVGHEAIVDFSLYSSGNGNFISPAYSNTYKGIHFTDTRGNYFFYTSTYYHEFHDCFFDFRSNGSTPFYTSNNFIIDNCHFLNDGGNFGYINYANWKITNCIFDGFATAFGCNYTGDYGGYIFDTTFINCTTALYSGTWNHTKRLAFYNVTNKTSGAFSSTNASDADDYNTWSVDSQIDPGYEDTTKGLVLPTVSNYLRGGNREGKKHATASVPAGYAKGFRGCDYNWVQPLGKYKVLRRTTLTTGWTPGGTVNPVTFDDARGTGYETNGGNGYVEKTISLGAGAVINRYWATGYLEENQTSGSQGRIDYDNTDSIHDLQADVGSGFVTKKFGEFINTTTLYGATDGDVLVRATLRTDGVD